MMRRSLLTVLLVLVATTSLAAAPPVNPADAIAFMNQVWNTGDRVAQQQNRSRDKAGPVPTVVPRSVRRSRYCPICSRPLLAKRRRKKQQELVKTFENYVAFVYTARLANLGGQTFKIRGSRSDGDGVIVSTDVISPGSTSPLKIDWRLVNDNGGYRINDVIVEGIGVGGHPTLRIRLDHAAQRRSTTRSDFYDAGKDGKRGALTATHDRCHTTAELRIFASALSMSEQLCLTRWRVNPYLICYKSARKVAHAVWFYARR